MNCYRTDLTFLRLLRKCYFHPSRNPEFPYSEIKYMALAAMLLLWKKDKINLFGKTYNRSRIRRIVIEQMMPEHLDNAVNFFVHSKELTTVNHLAELIFAYTIHDGTLIDIQFERDFGDTA